MKHCKDCKAELVLGHYCYVLFDVDIENREYVANYKMSKGCESSSCLGHPNHPSVLQLAHINKSEKDSTLKQRRAYNPSWSLDRIKLEISKCRVLCANCHSLETYEEHYK